jgi:glycosyltransferase involved in cell wall biosynthesis
MKITVDIVIPVLNEEETISANIVTIVNFCEVTLHDKYDYKIIIADNGSTDQTPMLAKELEAQFSQKVVYHKVARKGVGLALKSAWSASKSLLVGYMDLDMATDLRHLPEALNALINNGADIVYGSRLHKKSQVIGRTMKREVTSRIFNAIVKNYLGTSFSDGMCGFKFLKRMHLEAIMADGAISDGWFFCTELLVVGQWKGLNVYELPVKWTDDPNSKVNIKKLAKEYIEAMRQLKKTRAC